MPKTEGYNLCFRLPDGRPGTRITAEADEESVKAYLKTKYPNVKIVSCHGLDVAELAALGLEPGHSLEWVSPDSITDKG